MALRNAFESVATETTVKALQRGVADQEVRIEWVAVGDADYPLYKGIAAPGTLASASGWAIQKFTWGSGPAGGTVLTRSQTLVGVWNDRASLGW